MTRGFERIIESHAMVWRGIPVTVKFERHAFGDVDSRYRTSHLQVECTDAGRVLPITETGYRSHFLPPEAVDELGGPIAYVSQWLDVAAQSRKWREIERSQQQMSLF